MLCGCDIPETDEDKILRLHVELMEKHNKWHEKHGFDFSLNCSMCGKSNVMAQEIISEQNLRGRDSRGRN
jgi:hypothetical protein